MENLRFSASLPNRAQGGQLQKMQPGGLVQGPSHEQGGIPVVDGSQEPIAEIEGGERIFSVEDTAQIEQMSMAIIQASQQDPQAAQAMATELGMAVVQMVAKQEVVNPAPPQAMPGMEGGVGEIGLPGGGNDAYMEQPI